jgi:hypothetical protein
MNFWLKTLHPKSLLAKRLHLKMLSPMRARKARFGIRTGQIVNQGQSTIQIRKAGVRPGFFLPFFMTYPRIPQH